jgi:hypothetical protein
MIALPEPLAAPLVDALVEWTALSLGVALTVVLLLRPRRFQSWPRYGLPCVALMVIVANAGIAVTAAAAAARSEAAGAWNAWLAPRADVHLAGPAAGPSVPDVGGGIASVIGGAGLLLASMLAVSKAWTGLRSHRQALVADVPETHVAPAGFTAACGACPHCVDEAAGVTQPAGRRRARGLTITRL